MSWWSFRPYVSVAARRAKAKKEAQRLVSKGHQVQPVEIDGRTIAETFWGKAWCDNLESYSDFANRLPRGRTYVRNGSVVDLQIEPGKVTSLVSGSEVYRITVKIKPLAPAHWKAVQSRCAGQIGSLVELLQGKLSSSVMQVVTARDAGLFPRPAEIEMSCSCPDWAGMCKHVAATLYGVGNRLDHQPDLLFKLRQVDHAELIAQATVPTAKAGSQKTRRIAEDKLGDVFGIELDASMPGKAEKAATRVRSRSVKTPGADAAGPETPSPRTTGRRRSKAVKGA